MANIILNDNSQAIIDQLDRRVLLMLDVLGKTAEGYAKQRITDLDAVDNGVLRNSITHTVDGNTVHIGTNVEYAPYIEFGTGRYSSIGGGTYQESWVYRDKLGHYHRAYPQKPRPFLGPAIGEHLSEYREIMQFILEK